MAVADHSIASNLPILYRVDQPNSNVVVFRGANVALAKANGLIHGGGYSGGTGRYGGTTGRYDGSHGKGHANEYTDRPESTYAPSTTPIYTTTTTTTTTVPTTTTTPYTTTTTTTAAPTYVYSTYKPPPATYNPIYTPPPYTQKHEPRYNAAAAYDYAPVGHLFNMAPLNASFLKVDSFLG